MEKTLEEWYDHWVKAEKEYQEKLKDHTYTKYGVELLTGGLRFVRIMKEVTGSFDMGR